MTNKFAVVLYPLESKGSDPIARCISVEKAGKEIAISPEPHVNLFLTQLIGVAPSVFSKFFIYNTQSTVVISNLPGPDRRISIWDMPLVETMFWLPNVGHSGISVSFLSYKDTIRIGMTVDKGVVRDGQQGTRHLINLTVRELEKMARMVGINPKGHGIPRDLLIEPSVSDDELEELLLPDSSPLLSSKRKRRNRERYFKDSDSVSSSSEDFGYVEEESLEDDDEFSDELNKPTSSRRNDNSDVSQQKTELYSDIRSRKLGYNTSQEL